MSIDKYATTLKRASPNIIEIRNRNAVEVIRITPDGRLFWHGREVETDDDFRAAMLELKEAFSPKQVKAVPSDVGKCSACLEAHAVLDADPSKIIRNAEDGYPSGRNPKILSLAERVSALCVYAADWKRWCTEKDNAPLANQIDRGVVVSFAVDRWFAEVANRPLINVHRRTLDDTWRQVIRKFGGDPDALIGPDHDTLLAAQGEKP